MVKELYADLAIRFMSRLCWKQLNPIIDLELLRKNKYIENLVVIAGKVGGKSSQRGSLSGSRVLCSLLR
jgi:hypothetical protein